MGRGDGDFLVHYPVSCSPQAWASAAFFLLLQSVLGLEPEAPLGRLTIRNPRDRKSTRLNSSHSQISYAVFCLKKKKTELPRTYSTERTRHPSSCLCAAPVINGRTSHIALSIHHNALHTPNETA